jgi:hypothetical protein
MRARKLSYACVFRCRTGEPFWIRELSFTLVQVGSTLGLVDSKASLEQGDLLFLLVLSIVTMGVDRTFQLEALETSEKRWLTLFQSPVSMVDGFG